MNVTLHTGRSHVKGFVIARNLVLTVAHIQADQCTAYFADGRYIREGVVRRRGTDVDLALVAVDTSGYTPATLAASAPQRGDRLTVLGQGTTCTGRLGPKLCAFDGVRLQPGDSGTPIFNAADEVVGILTLGDARYGAAFVDVDAIREFLR